MRFSQVSSIQPSNDASLSATSSDWESNSDDATDPISHSSTITFGGSSNGENGLSGQNGISAGVNLGRLGSSVEFDGIGGESRLGEIIGEISGLGQTSSGVGGMGETFGGQGMSGLFGSSNSNVMDRFGRLIRGDRLGRWSGSVGTGGSGGVGESIGVGGSSGSFGLDGSFGLGESRGSGGSFGFGGSMGSGGSFGIEGSRGSGGSFGAGGSRRNGGYFDLGGSSGSGRYFKLGTDGSSESDTTGGLNVKYGRMDGHRGGVGLGGSNQIGGTNRMGSLNSGMGGVGVSGNGIASGVSELDREGRMNGFNTDFGGSSQTGGMSNFGTSGDSNGMHGFHLGGLNRLRRHILPRVNGGSLQVTRTPITLTWSQ